MAAKKNIKLSNNTKQEQIKKKTTLEVYYELNKKGILKEKRKWSYEIVE